MTVAYFNMKRLLERLDLERLQGHVIKFLNRLVKTDLLILDDFGMKKLQGQQQNDFEQLVDDPYRKKLAYVTLQYKLIESQLPLHGGSRCLVFDEKLRPIRKMRRPSLLYGRLYCFSLIWSIASCAVLSNFSSMT